MDREESMAGNGGSDNSQMTTAAALVNSTGNSTSDITQLIPTTSEVVILSISEGLVLLLSTFIILLIWIKKDLRRNYTNWLVSNACFVLLVGTIGHIWQYIVLISQGSVVGAGCWVGTFSESMLLFNRPVSLLLMSVTCAVFVYDPLTFSEKITKKVILLMIGLDWLVSIVQAGVRTANISVSINQAQKGCFDEDDYRNLSVTVVHIITVSLLLVVALVVFVYSYRHHRNSPKGDPELATERWKQAMQATILTGTMSGLYIIMTLPFFVAVMQSYINPNSFSSHTAYIMNSIYDVIQLVLWMTMLPNVTHSIKSLSQCCAYDKTEYTSLLLAPHQGRGAY